MSSLSEQVEASWPPHAVDANIGHTHNPLATRRCRDYRFWRRKMNWGVPTVQGVRPVCLLHCRSFFACEEDVRTFHFCTSCCDRSPVSLGFWSGFCSLKNWEWCIQIPYWSGGIVRLILHDTLVPPLPWSFLILHAGVDISSILNAERLVMSDCTFKQQLFLGWNSLKCHAKNLESSFACNWRKQRNWHNTLKVIRSILMERWRMFHWHFHSKSVRWHCSDMSLLLTGFVQIPITAKEGYHSSQSVGCKLAVLGRTLCVDW